MSANLMSLARSGGKFLKLFGDRKMVKTMPTARDYVQDGLIAMFDGIENAGFGTNDANATVWVDLSGNGNDVGVDLTQASWEDRFLKVTGTTCTRDEEITNIATLEVLFRDPSGYIYPNNKGPFFVLGECKGPCCLWYGHVSGGSSRITRISSNNAVSKDILASRSFTYSPWSYYVNGEQMPLYNPPNTLADAVGCKATAVGGKPIEIYHVRAYSRALTADEIAHNYAIDKARFNLTTPTI